MDEFVMLESNAPYMIAAGALVFIALMLLPRGKHTVGMIHREVYCLIALPVCVFMAHFCYCVFDFIGSLIGTVMEKTFTSAFFANWNWLDPLIPWNDGQTIFGVYLGLILSAWICGKLFGISGKDLLDLSVLPAALFTAICCFAMPLYNAGYGKEFNEGDLGKLTVIGSVFGYVTDVENPEYMKLAVWAIMGLTSVGLAIWAAADQKERAKGMKALLYIVQYAGFNLLFSVMINSRHLRLWMAETDQILCAVILLSVLIAAFVRTKGKAKQIPNVISFLFFTALGIAFTMELQNKLGKLFKKLDGDTGSMEHFFTMPRCYMIILVCGILMAVIVWNAVLKAQKSRKE